MATSQERRRAQARTARQLRAGSYKPAGVTRKARRAAAFIEPIQPEDRDTVIKIKMQDWWNNGESLGDYRRFGSADSVYNYANDLSAHGVPDNIINITSTSTDGIFFIYAGRDTG